MSFFKAEDFEPAAGLPQVDIIHVDIAAERANAKRDEEVERLRAALDIAEDQLRGLMHDNVRLREALGEKE